MSPFPSKYIAAITAAIVLLGINIVYVSHFTGFIHPASAVLETDHYRYMAMVRRGDTPAQQRLAHEPPFCWRILIPFIVSLLSETGAGLNGAYYLVTNLLLGFYLFIFYLYLRELGFGGIYALAGIILVGLTPGAVRWYEYQYWMTDPAGLFFVILGFYLIRSGKYFGLLAVSVAAVLARETYLAVPVYYFFSQWQKEDLRTALRKCAPVIVIPVALLIVIRVLIPSGGDYNLGGIGRKVISFRIENFWPQQLYFTTLGSFGVIFPLLFLFPSRLAGGYWKKHYPGLIYVLLIYSSLAAGYNTDRLLAYALPVLLVYALKNLKKMIDCSGVRPGGWIAAVILLQLLFYLSTRFYGFPAVSIFQPVSLPVTFSLLCFWILSGMIAYFRRCPPRTL